MNPEELETENGSGDRATEILKSISVFDVDDIDIESREDLALMFNELIMMDDDTSREFVERFLNGTKDVIRDMGLIDDDAERETTDEVDMTPPKGEEEVSKDEKGPEDEKVAGEEIPDDLFDNYNRMINTANTYIY